MPANCGRYFADQVVLQAIDAPYLLVHDADDWSEPQRVEILLRELRRRHAAVALSAARRPGAARVDAARIARPLGPRLEHRAPYHGLYRTDALRAIGGFYAGFAVGFDTYLLNVLAMTGAVAIVDEPLYHWRPRAGSLSRAPATGAASALRREARREQNAMYRAAYAAYGEYLDGHRDADALARTLRELTR